MSQLIDIQPDDYQKHRIHTQERDWAETNCYVDVWIELCHALGHEPVAAMPFTLAIDFEGDQWTFFKFPLQDLYRLYGIEVQELAVWKPMLEHIEQQLSMGRGFLIELDSKYLPDTAGTAYQREHVKTTVAINRLDVKNRQMDYFHAQGFYRLSGEDFVNVFRLGETQDASVLPPYVEIAKLQRKPQLTQEELVLASKEILVRTLNQLPSQNPFIPFKVKLSEDLKWLADESLDTFHLYSFATLRQFGACFELSVNYLNWLQENGEQGLAGIIADIKSISELAKVYQFQLARAMSRKKELDLATLDAMANHWQNAMDGLKRLYL